MYQSSCSRPTSTTRDDAMMATMRLISSTPEAYHTYHFYRGDVGAMLPPKICYNQSINIFIANSKLSIIIYYRPTAKNRAPKFSAGLLQILCWEPGGLPSFKVSGDPCTSNYGFNKYCFYPEYGPLMSVKTHITNVYACSIHPQYLDNSCMV